MSSEGTAQAWTHDQNLTHKFPAGKEAPLSARKTAKTTGSKTFQPARAIRKLGQNLVVP